MPTKKIGDTVDTPWRLNICAHPEHNPPKYQVFPNGVYEHTCPSCGNVIIFTVNSPVYHNHEWHEHRTE